MCADRVQRPKTPGAKREGRTPASAATRQGRVNLSPLAPEKALRAFMQVDPKKVREREERERSERQKQPRGRK